MGAPHPSSPPATRFELDLSRDLASEWARVLCEQIDAATHRLRVEGASEKAVHEARKACKRSRAAVQLVRSALGRRTTKRLDRAFRDAARLLGPVRDADVARRSADRVLHAEVPDREERGEKTVAALEEARSIVLDAQPDALPLRVWLEGVVASWSAAHQGWSEAELEVDPEAFHEWRKHVKRLLYHVQLLGPLSPPILGGLHQQLDMLQEALGDHHDLCVFAEQFGTGAEDRDHERRTRTAELEARTAAVGRWVLGRAPAEFRRWLLATSAPFAQHPGARTEE